jgi:hypothetical protein
MVALSQDGRWRSLRVTGSATAVRRDVFSGIFAENVVFTEKREKTAHNFIFDFGHSGYFEVIGHCI